MHSMLER
jgi:hypothetical protein